MSKFIPKFFGNVDSKGKLILEEQELFDVYLGSLVNSKVELTVKKFRKNRSLKANAYYWVCLSYIANEIGEELEDLHTTFKAMFLVDRTKPIPIVRSTTTLNSLEFMDYLIKIAERVGRIGITLPSPDDYYKIELE